MRLLLLPFSLVYALVIFMRNRLYDWGLLKSTRFDTPTINVGNLALGGTGKTPHIEWLIEQLADQKLAVLSRGYGRKTTGTIEVETTHQTREVGDEPLQIKLNHPHVQVVVDEQRVRGMAHIDNDKIVLLDDAFQHRKITPSFNLLLTTFDRPFFSDWIVPAGNLRDNRYEKRRADAIIITKCPVLSDQEKAEYRSATGIDESRVWFSSISYGNAYPLWDDCPALPSQIIGLAAIANPALFKSELDSRFELMDFIAFRDHREFAKADAQMLADRIGTFDGGIVTTAKDAARLRKFESELRHLPVFVLPIKTEIEHGDQLISLIKESI